MYYTFGSCQGHDYRRQEDQRAFAPPPGKLFPLLCLQTPEFQNVSANITQDLYITSFSAE